MNDCSDDDVRAWLTMMSTQGTLDLEAPGRALATQALFMINGAVMPAPHPSPAPGPAAPIPKSITPAVILNAFIDPTLRWLATHAGVPVSDQARVMCLTIAGQESNWQYRKQIGGPARSFWQFEQGGGVAGVLQHASSKDKIKAFCAAALIDCTVSTVYEAMAWNDFLGAAMTRLLLWTDAQALPAVGDVQGAWSLYLRVWRPGMPHPQSWPQRYATSMSLI